MIQRLGHRQEGKVDNLGDRSTGVSECSMHITRRLDMIKVLLGNAILGSGKTRSIKQDTIVGTFASPHPKYRALIRAIAIEGDAIQHLLFCLWI